MEQWKFGVLRSGGHHQVMENGEPGMVVHALYVQPDDGGPTLPVPGDEHANWVGRRVRYREGRGYAVNLSLADHRGS